MSLCYIYIYIFPVLVSVFRDETVLGMDIAKDPELSQKKNYGTERDGKSQSQQIFLGSGSFGTRLRVGSGISESREQPLVLVYFFFILDEFLGFF